MYNKLITKKTKTCTQILSYNMKYVIKWHTLRDHRGRIMITALQSSVCTESMKMRNNELRENVV